MKIKSWKVFCFDEVTSTNDVARKLAREAESNIIVVADSQTKGKGQYGRKWESPPGKNLLSTYAVKFPGNFPFELISFVAGNSVAEILSGIGIQVNCKWPNDILANGSKIAGILIEKDEKWYYIGIGLNILWPESKTNFNNKVSWTSIIGEANLTLSRETFINKIAGSFDYWRSKNRKDILDKYNSFWKDKNKMVKIDIDGNWLPGKLISILNDGGVEAELNCGEKVYIYSSAKLNYEY